MAFNGKSGTEKNMMTQLKPFEPLKLRKSFNLVKAVNIVL